MNTRNLSLDGILPGLIYLTGAHPSNQILVWGERSESGEIYIAVFDAEAPLGQSLPARAVQSVRSVTLVGYGPAAIINEPVHQLCALYAALGITVKGRYRVEGTSYYDLPAIPVARPKSALLPYRFEHEDAIPTLGSNIVQAEFQVTAAQVQLDLARMYPEHRRSRLAGREAAGAHVLKLLKDGRPVEDLSLEEKAQLALWTASKDGFIEAFDFTLEASQPEQPLEQWKSLLAVVPDGFVPVPASLMAIAAWRSHRPLLARNAVNLAKSWASEILPPVHQIAGDWIDEDIYRLATR